MIYLSRFLLLSLFFTFISCHFFGPVDSSSLKRIYSKPEMSDIIGKREVDSFSYKQVSKDFKIESKEITLTFLKNGTFQLKNLPVYHPNGEPVKVTSMVKGKWKLYKPFKKEYWEMNMHFYNYSTNYFLYKRENQIIIIYFLGDPDLGKRLLFEKTMIVMRNSNLF